MAKVEWLDGGITAVPGILASGVAAGIKPGGKKDLALVYSASPARAAAMFTTNQVKGAPVIVSMEHIRGGEAQAIVASSGCSNVCTGDEGLRAAREMTKIVGELLRIPAKAVLVAPSIVSDRYVQLTPVWTGGDTLPDGTHLSLGRTAAPVELDQIYANIDELNKALGPNGANKNGALSNLLNVGADNLNGNGAALGNMIAQLGAATRTLSGSQDNLFQTIDKGVAVQVDKHLGVRVPPGELASDVHGQGRFAHPGHPVDLEDNRGGAVSTCGNGADVGRKAGWRSSFNSFREQELVHLLLQSNVRVANLNRR